MEKQHTRLTVMSTMTDDTLNGLAHGWFSDQMFFNSLTDLQLPEELYQ
jgi:hypothetical protein